MPLLKGNLHTHTTFSDGRLPADEVVARYRELGYDFLAITDHDDRIDDEYWFRIPPGDDRMLVLAGVEIEAARNPDAILRAIKAGEFSVRFAGARRQRFGSWGR